MKRCTQRNTRRSHWNTKKTMRPCIASRGETQEENRWMLGNNGEDCTSTITRHGNQMRHREHVPTAHESHVVNPRHTLELCERFAISSCGFTSLSQHMSLRFPSSLPAVHGHTVMTTPEASAAGTFAETRASLAAAAFSGCGCRAASVARSSVLTSFATLRAPSVVVPYASAAFVLLGFFVRVALPTP